MHFIRRAALRAASSPSTSFVSKQRSITTSSPFALRSKVQSGVNSSVFRRFASDETSSSEQHENENGVESADDEHGAVRSAIDSAASYAGDAAESLTHNAEEAKDAVAGAASGAAAAAGIAYQPREDRRTYGNNRGDRDGGRGGFGGGNREPRLYDNNRSDRGGFAERGERPSRPDRVVTPSSTIYVGNLLFDVTTHDIEKEFHEFGTIKNAFIATDARGLSKGFGYIEFETIDQANAAIAAKHQSVMEGRRLVVNYQAKSNRSTIQNPPSKTLFIGNLAFEMSDADLNKLFRDIRNVIDVRVAIDRRTGQPRGFAHADFIDEESAIKARDTLMGKEVFGRALRVDFSTSASDNRPPRDDRSSS